MMVSRVVVASFLFVALAGCGGGDDDASGAVTTPPAADTTDPPTDTTGTDTTDPATTAAPVTTAAPATTAPAPTTVPVPEPVEFDLGALPALVEQLADIATVEPLPYARALGFPLDIDVPDGSTLYRIDTTVSARERDEATFNEVDTGYAVIAPDGSIPDVDINLDDNGPGSVQIIEVWDPIMTELGYERKNSTTSDPGEPGGPNTVNHVYVPTEAAAHDVNGHPADITTVYVWADEDLTGASYDSSEPPLQGGYRIDLSADADEGVVPIPVLGAVIDAMPVPDGATLQGADLRLQSRSADSYDADSGANYLEITLEWAAAPDATPDQLAAFYAEADFDGETLIAAEPSFFDEGSYELAEVSGYGDTDYRLPVLFLRRYEGVLSLSVPYDAEDPTEITYRITLNPTDMVLSPAE